VISVRVSDRYLNHRKNKVRPGCYPRHRQMILQCSWAFW